MGAKSIDAEVVIVGAGIGGATLAAALLFRGIDFLLLERQTMVQPLGAGIALMPPALAVADHLGLGPAFRESSVVLPTLRRCRPDGTVLAEIPYGSVWAGREVRGIKRSKMIELVLNAVPPNQVRLGDEVVGTESQEADVVVRLASDDELRGHLVVGADGVHSAVREAVAPHIQPSPSGQRYLRSFLPGEPLVDTYTAWVGRGRSFGLVPVREGTHVFGLEVSDDTSFRPVAGRAQRARHQFEEFTASPAREALARLQDLDVHEGPGWEVDLPPESWHSGRIVLLGDATHAMAPPMGLGGAMAMEDAIVLAEELDAGFDDAAQRWTARRRTRIDHLQRATRSWLRDAAAGQLIDPEATLRATYLPLLAAP